MQFRHDFSNMEKEDLSKKRKDRPVYKKEHLNNMNSQENPKEIENWVDLKYYKKESIQTHQILEKLSCDKICNNSEISLLSQEDYFKLIFKNINNDALTEQLNEKVYKTEKIISSKDLVNLPLIDQVENIFKKASVLSYDIIFNILGIEKDYSKYFYENKNSLSNNKINILKKKEKEVLDLILLYSNILKSGNFIYKSELRYDYITDLEKKENLIKKRNTIVNILQNNPETGVKKRYFTGISEEILTEILSESCEKIKSFYFLREKIFPKYHSEEFKSRFPDIYFKEIGYWNKTIYDKDIKINIITDEDSLNLIENISLDSNNQKDKIKTFTNNLNEKNNEKIKVPISLTRNSNSFRDLGMNSDYKIVNSAKNNENMMVIDDVCESSTTIENNSSNLEENNVNKKNGKKKYGVEASPSKKNEKKNKLENENILLDAKEEAQKTINDSIVGTVNPEILKDNLLKNFNQDSCFKKTELIQKILDEFSDFNNKDGLIILNNVIDQLFFEINDNLFIRDLEDKESDRTWKILLNLFSKNKSYKKTEIKKSLSDDNIQITDQNLNKLLKKIASYSNLNWNIKE